MRWSADKGGGIVLQNYCDYHAEVIRILSDDAYYCKVYRDPFPDIQVVLQKLLTKAQEEGVLTKKECNFIYIKGPNIPLFYHLSKAHKSLWNPPGRPIISGIRSNACNLSHYINIYLQDFVKDLKSYLKDSDSLINLLNEWEWESGTNIFNNKRYHTIFEH